MRQIGNAVPVKLAEVVASSVAQFLGNSKKIKYQGLARGIAPTVNNSL